jgi:alpha-beta hydrolase superfamily lysophospholipase
LLCYYDQRGAGFSKSKKKNLTIENYQLDLEILVSRLKIASPNKKLVLFGHCWGGFLANKYLSNVRGREVFTSLISMDGVHNFPLTFQSQKSSII